MKSHQHPGYIREDFDITPNMSTYLVAFMVTDLVRVNTSKNFPEKSNLPEISIWTRKSVADMTL